MLTCTKGGELALARRAEERRLEAQLWKGGPRGESIRRTPTQGLDRLQSYRKELEDELEAVVTGWLSLRDSHHHANQRYRIVPDIHIGLEANRADALGAGRGVYAWMVVLLL